MVDRDPHANSFIKRQMRVGGYAAPPSAAPLGSSGTAAERTAAADSSFGVGGRGAAQQDQFDTEFGDGSDLVALWETVAAAADPTSSQLPPAGTTASSSSAPVLLPARKRPYSALGRASASGAPGRMDRRVGGAAAAAAAADEEEEEEEEEEGEDGDEEEAAAGVREGEEDEDKDDGEQDGEDDEKANGAARVRRVPARPKGADQSATPPQRKRVRLNGEGASLEADVARLQDEVNQLRSRVNVASRNAAELRKENKRLLSDNSIKEGATTQLRRKIEELQRASMASAMQGGRPSPAEQSRHDARVREVERQLDLARAEHDALEMENEALKHQTSKLNADLAEAERLNARLRDGVQAANAWAEAHPHPRPLTSPLRPEQLPLPAPPPAFRSPPAAPATPSWKSPPGSRLRTRTDPAAVDAPGVRAEAAVAAGELVGPERDDAAAVQDNSAETGGVDTVTVTATTTAAAAAATAMAQPPPRSVHRASSLSASLPSSLAAADELEGGRGLGAADRNRRQASRLLMSALGARRSASHQRSDLLAVVGSLAVLETRGAAALTGSDEAAAPAAEAEAARDRLCGAAAGGAQSPRLADRAAGLVVPLSDVLVRTLALSDRVHSTLSAVASGISPPTDVLEMFSALVSHGTVWGAHLGAAGDPDGTGSDQARPFWELVEKSMDLADSVLTDSAWARATLFGGAAAEARVRSRVLLPGEAGPDPGPRSALDLDPAGGHGATAAAAAAAVVVVVRPPSDDPVVSLAGGAAWSPVPALRPCGDASSSSCAERGEVNGRAFVEGVVYLCRRCSALGQWHTLRRGLGFLVRLAAWSPPRCFAWFDGVATVAVASGGGGGGGGRRASGSSGAAEVVDEGGSFGGPGSGSCGPEAGESLLSRLFQPASCGGAPAEVRVVALELLTALVRYRALVGVMFDCEHGQPVPPLQRKQCPEPRCNNALMRRVSGLLDDAAEPSAAGWLRAQLRLGAARFMSQVLAHHGRRGLLMLLDPAKARCDLLSPQPQHRGVLSPAAHAHHRPAASSRASSPSDELFLKRLVRLLDSEVAALGASPEVRGGRGGACGLLSRTGTDETMRRVRVQLVAETVVLLRAVYAQVSTAELRTQLGSLDYLAVGTLGRLAQARFPDEPLSSVAERAHEIRQILLDEVLAFGNEADDPHLVAPEDGDALVPAGHAQKQQLPEAHDRPSSSAASGARDVRGGIAEAAEAAEAADVAPAPRASPAPVRVAAAAAAAAAAGSTARTTKRPPNAATAAVTSGAPAEPPYANSKRPVAVTSKAGRGAHNSADRRRRRSSQLFSDIERTEGAFTQSALAATTTAPRRT